MNRLFLYLLIVTFANSCGKDEITASDKTVLAIIITSPASGQIFIAGQPISITGTITDNNTIAEVHIHVTNITTSALLMDVHLSPDAPSASFNQSITSMAGVNYKIQIIAIDKSVNEGRQSVEVSTN